MRHADPSRNPEPYEVIANELVQQLEHGIDPCEVEGVLMRHLMAIGGLALTKWLAGAARTQPFTEDGIAWTPAVTSTLRLVSLFGPVDVERTLFRSQRNGPTRCLVTERLGLVRDFWTSQAAKIGALTIGEMPMQRAEEFFKELGIIRASRSSLLRLGASLSELWESDREQHEEAMRQAAEVPKDAVSVAVSLDGVMVTLVDSARADLKDAAQARGVPAKGPSGWSEASVGVLTFYNADGTRVGTRRYARMPEEQKQATKGWLRSELEHVRRVRPDLVEVAIADGAANNWTFMEALEVDHEVVDFFHTADHLHRHVNLANGAATVATQQKLKRMRRQLLEEDGGANRVFAELERLRKAAGTEAPSAGKKSGRRQPTYWERHHSRMNYAALRSQNLPIGSGVTESTCKLAVCDRLRRTGMRWTVRGGQAVLTLRVLRINAEFDLAWTRLMAANRERLAA